MTNYELHNRRVLLIISGGIAAYKTLELIRRLREAGASVRCVLTKGGAQFVTPLSVAALSEDKVYDDLWSLTDEAQMGHIRLSREADLIAVVPASANMIAKMAQGLAADLASTVLLATNRPVMIAPAMNVMMWSHAATQANIATLRARGIAVIGPDSGAMACNEEGAGRMSEPAAILAAIAGHFALPGALAGKKALVTSGPTFEAIDPVRFLGNRSSGKQGHAIAAALAAQGAETVLVTGPTALADPPGMKVIHIESAQQMLAMCELELPVDIAVCAAAVADWRADSIAGDKLKKGAVPATLKLIENPDILTTLSQAGNRRPKLVVGFAAETSDLALRAQEKLKRKGCDWLIANEVGATKGFGTDDNEVLVLKADREGEAWPRQNKNEIARRLTEEIGIFFKTA